jgi:glycosyltransferase involved in cell wall biosynthesis
MVLNGWGRLKNPWTALRAFALLRRDFPAAELHMFGSGFGPGQRAEAWARAHGVEDGMVFHGLTQYEHLMERLSEVDMLVHPALEECCSMTIVEAMTLGLPVIGGRSSGGVPWQLGNGNAGVLVDVTSAEQIAEACRSLIFDAARYAEIGRAAVSRSNQLFGRTLVVEAYESSYREAINSHSIEVGRGLGSASFSDPGKL